MVSTLIFTLGAVVFLSSCGKDDDNEIPADPNTDQSQNSSQNTKKDESDWYVWGGSSIGWSGYNSSVYASKVMEDCAAYYDNIDADGNVDSKEMYSTKSAVRLVNGNTIEYWTFNVGIWGCRESLNSKYYWYANNDYRSYFEGEFKPEKIICYSAEQRYQYTYAEIEGKLYVSDGSIYTRSKNGLIKDGVSGEYSKTDVNISNFENEKKIANRCKSEVRCSERYEADYPNTYSISITTPFPRTCDYNNLIVYGVEYGESCTSDYVVEGITPINGKVDIYISILFGSNINDYAKAEVIVNSLKTKMNSGEALSASEERLYKTALDTMDKLLTKMKQNFEAKVYVRYGGTKYYIGNI